MKVQYNASVKELNTFHVDVSVSCLCIIENDDDISDFFKSDIQKQNILILGGGSNILFTKDFNGTILLIQNQGIEILEDKKEYLSVKVDSGEKWDSFVQWSVKNNLVGLHNLAFIPGTTGATPVQNVGAYGVEIKDFLTEICYVDINTHEEKLLKNGDCLFKYRDSIFKNDLKNKALIKNVTFKLPKFSREIDDKYLVYAGIKEWFNGKEINPPNMYECIKEIRQGKLPEVTQYGSCGSTFKNPEITIKQYENLLKEFPELPKYETEQPDIFKIPAAYILEKLGWKNKRIGNVGTWVYHPLIVTNYGDATGEEIYSFIKSMQDSFKSATDLNLDCEINII